jgi:ribonuclease BN (tRNA processing enzyme)
MSFKVTVLGSSGMFATRDRAASGYLVRSDDLTVWVDAGGGTWRNLLRHVDYDQIDAIVLSHRHPDHTIDLFQMLHARLHGGDEPLPPIPLIANSETLERVDSYVGDLSEAFNFTEVAAAGSIKLGSLALSFFQMQHWCDTLGLRMEDSDGSWAYSSDTGPEGDILELARDVDLFVCEATIQDSDPESIGHLRASQAGSFAASAGVGRLVLTHLPPASDLGLSLAEADATCEGISLELADDGKVYEVGA